MQKGPSKRKRIIYLSFDAPHTVALYQGYLLYTNLDFDRPPAPILRDACRGTHTAPSLRDAASSVQRAPSGVQAIAAGAKGRGNGRASQRPGARGGRPAPSSSTCRVAPRVWGRRAWGGCPCEPACGSSDARPCAGGSRRAACAASGASGCQRSAPIVGAHGASVPCCKFHGPIPTPMARPHWTQIRLASPPIHRAAGLQANAQPSILRYHVLISLVFPRLPTPPCPLQAGRLKLSPPPPLRILSRCVGSRHSGSTIPYCSCPLPYLSTWLSEPRLTVHPHVSPPSQCQHLTCIHHVPIPHQSVRSITFSPCRNCPSYQLTIFSALLSHLPRCICPSRPASCSCIYCPFATTSSKRKPRGTIRPLLDHVNKPASNSGAAVLVDTRLQC